MLIETLIVIGVKKLIVGAVAKSIVATKVAGVAKAASAIHFAGTVSDIQDTADVFSYVEDFETYSNAGNSYATQQAADAIHNTALNSDLNALQREEIFQRTGISV